ncbi:hypothetical protein VIGAN_03241400, partial [Vigna angularis var. angularis]
RLLQQKIMFNSICPIITLMVRYCQEHEVPHSKTRFQPFTIKHFGTDLHVVVIEIDASVKEQSDIWVQMKGVHCV